MNLSDCPSWPRFLTRETAAVYLGVSVDVFDAEVRAGIWPVPQKRGGKGGRLTWDRVLLDGAADRLSGVKEGGELVAASPPRSDGFAARLKGMKQHATAPRERSERRAA